MCGLVMYDNTVKDHQFVKLILIQISMAETGFMMLSIMN